MKLTMNNKKNFEKFKINKKLNFKKPRKVAVIKKDVEEKPRSPSNPSAKSFKYYLSVPMKHKLIQKFGLSKSFDKKQSNNNGGYNMYRSTKN